MITGKIIIQKDESIEYADILDQYYDRIIGMIKPSDIDEKFSLSSESDIINASAKYEIIFKRTE